MSHAAVTEPQPQVTGRRLSKFWRVALEASLLFSCLHGGAFSAELPDLVATARRSVLPVGTFSPTDSPRFSFRGTGFVVGDGHFVVSNFHVMPQASESGSTNARLMVLVPRPDRELEPRQAELVASDRLHDLALLRIDGDALPALTLDERPPVPEGTSVALMGYPIGGVLGFSTVTHRGIVSSLTRIALPALNAQQLSPRALAQLREGPFEIYQLDATAYPGNSGGPLLDLASGHVIGVINMVLVRGTRESALSNPTGITYAIPVRFVRALLDQREAR